MEQIKLNIVNFNDLLRQVELADKDHISFAKFVSDAEIFCENEKGDTIDENLTRYRKIWFDLEIINALSLDDWESAGKPKDWLQQWEAKYKNDAKEVISELRALLTIRKTF